MLEMSSLVVLCLLIESAVGVHVQESFKFMFIHFVFSFVVSALTLERLSGGMIWGLIATVDSWTDVQRPWWHCVCRVDKVPFQLWRGRDSHWAMHSRWPRALCLFLIFYS